MKNFFLMMAGVALFSASAPAVGASVLDFSPKPESVTRTSRPEIEISRKGDLKYQNGARRLPAKAVAKVNGSDDLYDVQTLLDENFSSLTSGNEADPTAVNITTPDGAIEGLPGWSGEEVYDAGGMLYVNMSLVEDPEWPGFFQPIGEIVTPDLRTTGEKILRVEFDLKGVAPKEGVDEDMYLDQLNVIVLGLSDEVPEDRRMIDFPYVKMTENWEHGVVEVVLPQTIELWPDDSDDEVECTLTGVRVKLQPSETPFFIDNVVVKTLVPKVAIPENLGYVGFTDSGFTALWDAVEGADEYKVTVYSGRFDSDNFQYILTEIEELSTPENSVEVKADTSGILFFTVAAISGGQPSPTSDPFMVYSVMPPTLSEPSDVTDKGFTASWTPAAGADFTEIWAYSSKTVSQEEKDYPYITLDFADAEDAHSNDGVLYLDDFSYGWVAFPGAVIEDGALVIDNNGAMWTGVDGKMMSGCPYDLSGIEGNVTLKVTARTKDYAGMAVGSGGYDPETGTTVTLDSYLVEELSQDWEEYSFSLNARNPQAMFIIQAYNLGVIEIKDVRIAVDFPEGSQITLPYYSIYTDKVSAEIPMPGVECDRVKYVGRSVKNLIVNMEGEDYILEEAISEYSEPKYVDVESGVAPVVGNGETAVKRYYDLSGRYIGTSQPVVPGIYLERGNSGMRKIMVR